MFTNESSFFTVLDKDDDFKNFIGKDTKIEVEMLGDPELRKLKKNDIIQIQRRGFFIVDAPYKEAGPYSCKPANIRLIAIPDGTPGSYGPPGKAAPAPLPAKAAAKKGDAKAPAVKPVAAKPAPVPAAASGEDLNDRITKQGEKVRQLKTDKADKPSVDAAVAELLSLKAQYKASTGSDWKPGQAPAAKAPTPAGGSADDLNASVAAQGEKVRELKSAKADKPTVDAAVAKLLELKASYKAATGKDWKPAPAGASPAKPVEAPKPAASSNEAQLSNDVAAQGEKVRELKSAKADKPTVDAAVAKLLELKGNYKAATGKDWKPAPAGAPPAKPVEAPKPAAGGNEDQLSNQVAAQGDKVRELKSAKADKPTVDAAVAKLLELKANYKTATGKDWKPAPAGAPPAKAAKEAPKPAPAAKESSPVADQLNDDIAAQGEKVRQLKADKADKVAVDTAISVLLGLKTKYKTVTGNDWKPASGNPAPKPAKKKEEAKAKPQKQEKKPAAQAATADSGAAQKQTRLGMEARKEDCLADWYSQVITKAEMLEYYDVSGCYILRPWAYSIWERIQVIKANFLLLVNFHFFV